jgi:predicted ATPase/signal transduction histidine kinase
MLERLRGVAGVAQPAEAPHYPGSVMLEDAGTASLAGMTKPLPVDKVIHLGLGLARAVAGMHQRGVIHRDIAPANIVVSDDGTPCLVDFALASSFAEIRPEFTHHAEIVGTLAYLAPEATGRTGRPVDQRADLYALGAVLYELAAGEPPFGTGDPLRLIHDHLARVPVPPTEANQALPAPLSEIIMHLLEKEPDNRYQTADGLVYDLEQLRHAQAHPASAALRVGEHDVGARLLQPSRLVGREAEAAALEAAFADALAGRCRGVLVAGAPGVGKTALIDQLRPVVTGRDGWFVAGKFDEYRRDLEFDAGYQAFRALGRLLLAEPEDALAELRMRIVAAAGANAGLLTAVLPEFAALLETPPDAGDPLTAQTRVQRAELAALRAVASRERPVVLFLDDLQWAGRTPLGFVDLVLSEEPADGLLLVGAYREDEVDAAHPLAAPLSRWRNQAAVQHLRLDNLPGPALAAMVAEMLHADLATVAGLAEAIEPYTLGNPYETVELLGALRRDGLMTATAAGWRWDEAAVRAHLGRSVVATLLAARAAALPEKSRQMLEAMACLGGRAELSLLQAAAGEPADVVDQALEPAVDDGLLVEEPGARPAVRFRHDRIREAVLGRLEPRRRRIMQLGMARRLAAVPELFAAAAEQYLLVADAVADAAERRQVVALLRRAAGQATLTGDYALVDALLTAALPLIDPGDTGTLAAVHTGCHAALYCLGRFEEADEEYRTIEGLCPAALDRASATEVQVRSVTHRTRFAEALRLGLDSLRELGIAVPAADQLAAELDHQFGYLSQWLDHTEAADDLARPDLTDPTLLAASSLINATQSAAYFAGDPAMVSWLGLEALRICLEHGPAPALVGPVTYSAFGAVLLRGDYVAGYRAARRILALGEARGYEPGTSQARMLFAVLSGWVEPIENSVRQGQRAREELIAGGDLANAGYTYYASLPGMLDCAPLDRYLTEAKSAVAFVRRTGSEQSAQVLDPYRWLAGVLLGESPPGEAVPADKYAGDPLAQFHVYLSYATAAAIFGDQAGLERHTAAAMALVPVLPGLYPTSVARLLRALALAGQARAADADQRGGPLSELDELTRWLAARAADAPDNFLHLVRLVEAERAWTAGDFRAAALAFDAAQREAAQRQRPWHRALIAEHAARFYLAHGIEHVGHDLLAQARQEYLAWGATAKVAQLDWAYQVQRPDAAAAVGEQSGDLPDRPAVTTGTIDLLGIVSASQALSSETSMGRLHSRVGQVLSAMTGATGVQLVLWDEDRQDWLLPASADGTVQASDTGQEDAAPMSVLRYVQRTREPLVVGDATGDDRFARDPYFAGANCCSLLAVPIFGRGALRAVLLLENRLVRDAFTTRRLDAVNLIAGQLAVSLDNAQLYAEYRRIAGEQAALRRVATVVARAAPSQEVFAAVIAEAGRVLGVDRAFLVRYDPSDTLEVVGTWDRTGAPGPTPRGKQLPLGGRNVTTLVWQTARPARIEYDEAISGEIGRVAAGDEGLRSSVGVPVSVEGQLWGAIVVAYTGGEFLPADTESRLAGFTELLATAIGNAEAQAEVTASRARIVAAADQARRRIERDLHDGAQQRLVTLALYLREAQAAAPSELSGQLGKAVAEATSALDELRETARGIHPAILADGGLRPALKALAGRSPVPIDLHIHADERLPEPVEVSAYYVVAEALTNAAKHARASAVVVEAEIDGDLLRVTVRDDGIGGARLAGSTGLAGLKDRVEALGGRIVLHSPRGAGTSLRAELPLTASRLPTLSRVPRQPAKPSTSPSSTSP